MNSLTASPVKICTCPQEVPSLPPWFAEVVVLAQHFAQRGIEDAIGQQVRLARGRAGSYDVSDFVALLLGYIVSGETTLQAFFDRLAPFASPCMALLVASISPIEQRSVASSPTSIHPASKRSDISFKHIPTSTALPTSTLVAS